MRSYRRVVSAHSRRRVLIGGVCLVGLAAALYVAAALLEFAGVPALGQVAGLLADVTPYVLLAGAVLVLLYVVVSNVARAPENENASSTLFSQTSTMQEMPPDDAKRPPGEGDG